MLFAGNVNVEVKESAAVHAILVAAAPISTVIICRSFMFFIFRFCGINFIVCVCFVLSIKRAVLLGRVGVRILLLLCFKETGSLFLPTSAAQSVFFSLDWANVTHKPNETM